MSLRRNFALLFAFVLPLSADITLDSLSAAAPAAPACTAAACAIFEGSQITLPFTAIAGDSVSDVVRFFNNLLNTGGGTGFGNLVTMFSKIDGPGDNSVGPDLGLPDPSTYSVNAVFLSEAPDGAATKYNGNGTIYSFYSDVPEPSTLICLATGLLALGRRLLKR
jgi:hypothetical protein